MSLCNLAEHVQVYQKNLDTSKPELTLTSFGWLGPHTTELSRPNSICAGLSQQKEEELRIRIPRATLSSNSGDSRGRRRSRK